MIGIALTIRARIAGNGAWFHCGRLPDERSSLPLSPFGEGPGTLTPGPLLPLKKHIYLFRAFYYGISEGIRTSCLVP
jgi:hypothetical protein